MKYNKYKEGHPELTGWKLWEGFKVALQKEESYRQLNGIKYDKPNMLEKDIRRKAEILALETKPDHLMTIEDYQRQYELLPRKEKGTKKRCFCGVYFQDNITWNKLCPDCKAKYLHHTEEMDADSIKPMKAEDIPLTATI